MAYAKLGSISHATMRPEDLIPTFMETLDELKEQLSFTGPEAKEDAGWDLEELFSWLDEFSPPYAYFGAHEGDGSDYGFWPQLDSIREAQQFGELSSGDCTPDVPPDDSGLFLVVSDHGNATLYEWQGSKWEEVWSVV